jgi:hypothetical protein
MTLPDSVGWAYGEGFEGMTYDPVFDCWRVNPEAITDVAIFTLRRAYFHLDESPISRRYGTFGPVDCDTALAQGLISTAIQAVKDGR